MQRRRRRQNGVLPFVLLVVGLLFVGTTFHWSTSPTDYRTGVLVDTNNLLLSNAARRLYTRNDTNCNSDGDDPNSDFPVGIPPAGVKLCEGDEWKLIFPIIVMLYMFWALAIVVDEFFVPSLDLISDACGFSPDVAGATLMAAGGSAPEFFTSLFSAVQEPPSPTGIGTIVGSAVFNVLFVIALCAIFSKDTLSLTWWPLARDVSYYSFSLIVLAVMFKVGGGENKIVWWEAAILFILYIGYVVLMKNSELLNAWVVDKVAAQKRRKKADGVVELVAAEEGTVVVDSGLGSAKAAARHTSSTRDIIGDGIQRHDSSTRDILVVGGEENALFLKPSKFRAGVLQMACHGSHVTAAGIAAVTAVKGNVYETAAQFDKDEDGTIDRSELKSLLETLSAGEAVTEANVDAAMKEIDTSGDGCIQLEEFAVWYASSEALLVAQMHATFKRFDANGDGSISKNEINIMLTELHGGNHLSDEETAAACAEFPTDSITLGAFEEWYVSSMFWSEAKKKQKEETDAAKPMSIWPPPPGKRGKVVWALSLPLTVTLFFTVPSTRRPSLNTIGWALTSFSVSILWIAIYSWLMVLSAETFSKTLGIPAQVTGITILAAGTSIPDLLSSVIVARQGFGDMAVSSSIGSNIFDILVGLPIPWLISIAAKGKPVDVGGGDIAVSVIILLGMLVAVVVIIKFSGWKLTKTLAGCMLGLYVVFVAEELGRSDWSS